MTASHMLPQSRSTSYFRYKFITDCGQFSILLSLKLQEFQISRIYIKQRLQQLQQQNLNVKDRPCQALFQLHNAMIQHTFCSRVDSKLLARNSAFFNAACNRAISAVDEVRALSISSLALKHRIRLINWLTIHISPWHGELNTLEFKLSV